MQDARCKNALRECNEERLYGQFLAMESTLCLVRVSYLEKVNLQVQEMWYECSKTIARRPSSLLSIRRVYF